MVSLSRRFLSTSPDFSTIIDSFDAPIRYACAYGSGVFKQASYEGKRQPMIDFIFGVTHPDHWHSLNIRQNRHHYSYIGRIGGGSAVTLMQKNLGAGIYYNPYVKINGFLVKYGVVGIESLINDLLHWETFFLAGRLQKPVNILRNDARIKLARRENMRNAVCVALLSLPREFSEEELFLEIAGLSYKGDFRMLFAENPRKIYNIVSNQMDLFRELYKPIIEETPIVNYISDTTLQQEDDNIQAKATMIARLPRNLLKKLISRHQTDTSQSELDPEFFKSLAASSHLANYSDRSLREIIGRPAIMQAIKGLLSAGPKRSATYVMNKMLKRVGY